MDSNLDYSEIPDCDSCLEDDYSELSGDNDTSPYPGDVIFIW